MKRFWFTLAAFLVLGQEVLAGWEWGGHAKYQFSLQLFNSDQAVARLIGRKPFLNSGKVRVNTAYRRGAWEVVAQGQLFMLQGSSLEARNDPRIEALGPSLFPLPDFSDSRQLFDLGRALSEGSSRLLFCRMDRLSLGFTHGPLSLRLGRQVSSWGDGLVFQVLDLFNPFPPNAIDTEYKPGIDMLTAQWLFSNGDDLQGIIVPRRPDRRRPITANESSAALKWRHLAGSLQIEVLGARHYRDTIAGLGLSGNIAAGVWRFNLAQTFTQDGDPVTSLLLNMDRSWVWGEKDVYGFVEYFRNGFGETHLGGSAEMLEPRLLARLNRGELFSLGRHELAGGIRLESTPLTTLEPTVLVNLSDASTYLLFRVHHDWRQDLTLDAGVQAGFGGDGTEYGGVYSSQLDGYVAPGRMIWFRVAEYF